MAKDLIIRSSAEEFITFKVQEKDKGIQVRYENETLWMTQRAIQFRRWATYILKEFSKKGYIIDKKRMANGAF